jgi:hypothetical protein
MSDIRIQFSYDTTDDQYSQSNELKKTATAEYVGPAVQYWEIDVETNRWTGSTLSKEVHDDFNERLDDGRYSVEIDCEKNPLMCSLAAVRFVSVVDQTEISEEIPESQPYVRDDPPAPDHTYERTEIFYDPEKKEFLPLRWKFPFVTWEKAIAIRDNALRNSDRQLSEDLPEGLKNSVLEYRQYLRDLTKVYGAAWIVTLTASGSGYAVGDRLQISDVRLKNNSVADDVMVTVTAVDGSGAITDFSTSSTRSLHVTDSVEFSNVYHTTNGSGLGAQFDVNKNKLISPWKITWKSSPLG